MVNKSPDALPPRFHVAHTFNTVEIVRHSYDQFEVIAYGCFGVVCRHRMFTYGRKRREWAIEQARQWAETLGLYFVGDFVNESELNQHIPN